MCTTGGSAGGELGARDFAACQVLRNAVMCIVYKTNKQSFESKAGACSATVVGILPAISVCIELDPNDREQNLKYQMSNSLSSEFPGFGQGLSQTYCCFKMELCVHVYRLL